MRFKMWILVCLVPFGRLAFACENLLKDPLIKSAYSEGLLGALDALGSVSHPARPVLGATAWTWAFGADMPREGAASASHAAVIIKPSGRPIVILDPHDQPRELLPVPGTRASIIVGQTTYTLRDDGGWHSNAAPAVAPADEMFAHATATLAAREGQRLLFWRLAGERGGWALTSMQGRPLDSDVVLGPHTILEFADGGRVQRDPDGTIREIPPVGQVRVFVTELEDAELASWVATARRSIESYAPSVNYPSFDEYAEGILVQADVPVSRSGFTAWVGPEKDGLRQVLLLDRAWGRFFEVSDFEGWNWSPTFRLRNSWTVFAKDRRWYTRGGGAPAGAEVMPQPRQPAPVAELDLAI